MADDPDDNVRFRAQIWGLVLGLPLFILIAFFDEAPGDKVVMMTVYGTFAGVFYVHRREIRNRHFLVASITMLVIELPAIFLIKVPQIQSGYIAALPVALVNYALVESVLRAVKRLFPAPDKTSAAS
jgi:hypothetical protein